MPLNVLSSRHKARKEQIEWWIDGRKEKRRNAECILVSNGDFGIWEITCAERCWLSGEWERAGDLLRPEPQRPVGAAANRQSWCASTNTHMHTGSTAVFGQSTLVCDLLCRGPFWLYIANRITSYLPLPPMPSLEVFDILLLPISWRFRFHESRLCFLKEKIGPDITPNVWVIWHMVILCIRLFFKH